MKQANPHKTAYLKAKDRVNEIWCAHPQCQLPVGDLGPVMPHEQVCVIMIAHGPLMVIRRVPSSKVQFLFDAWGYVGQPPY